MNLILHANYQYNMDKAENILYITDINKRLNFINSMFTKLIESAIIFIIYNINLNMSGG